MKAGGGSAGSEGGVELTAPVLGICLKGCGRTLGKVSLTQPEMVEGA